MPGGRRESWMFCAKCGISVLEGSRVCVNCGNPVATVGSAAAAVVSAPPATATPEPPLYAGFWRRVAASAIDTLVLVGAMLVPVIALSLAGVAEKTVELVYMGMSWVGGWLYYALQHSSSQQATLGKRAIGIKVTDLRGERIGFGRATGRYFATILSSLTLLVGFVMAGFTRQRQALHDMVAGTLVVSRNTRPADVATGALRPPQVSGGVIAIATLASLVPAIGIIAAISIPAYQDYTIRAQVAKGLSLAATYQAAVENAYAAGQPFEEVQSDALQLPNMYSPYVSSISITDGVIVVEYGGDAHERLSGTQLLLVPGSTATRKVVWTCGLAPVPDGVTPAISGHEQYTNVEPRYLPSDCRWD